VRSTIDLAHNLGLTVVAEGVENAAVLALLHALDCDEAQGYHMGKPMPPRSVYNVAVTRLSFRQKVHLAREDAIVATVKRLLAEKGFEQMTVDEVAAEVGIAKASLYKHFPSKEALAAAAMVQMMGMALDEGSQAQPARAPARSTSSRPSPAGRCRRSWPARCRPCRPRTRRCAMR
jgi:hypothetical protein